MGKDPEPVKICSCPPPEYVHGHWMHLVDPNCPVHGE